MIPFRCGRCGHAVFFENVRCGQCSALLGYLPGERCMGAFEVDGAPVATAADSPPPAAMPAVPVQDAGLLQGTAPVPDSALTAPLDAPVGAALEASLNVPLDANGAPMPDAAAPIAPPPDPGRVRWRRVGDACASAGQLFAPCNNRTEHEVCNWMLDPGDDSALCRSCRLTTTIPDLTVAGNPARWAAIEAAKRRLMFTLIDHGLDPEPKSVDPKGGLTLHLLAALPGGPPVMTGHASGVVTINIVEADDAAREATRVAFGEPVRSLLGHLRHEIGHYLQWRWITGTAADTARATFGDERDDYATALARYHAEGPPADWQQRFVSAYASAHPFEDWAETCAHVLLVSDAVQTAESWGLRLDGPVARARPKATRSQTMDRVVIEHWLPVAQFLNAMNRSLGLRDSYPFLMPDAVLQKMALVQRLLADAARRRRSANSRRLRAQAARAAGAPVPPLEAAEVQDVVEAQAPSDTAVDTVSPTEPGSAVPMAPVGP